MAKTRPADILLPLVTVLLDALAIEAAFLFSYWLRFRTTLFESFGFLREAAPPFTSYLLGSVAVILLWLLLFQFRRMYAVRRNVSYAEELINIVRVISFGMLFVLSATFFYRDFSYSRIVFGLLWATAILFVFAGRVVVSAYERSLHRRKRDLQHAVILGADAQANHVYAKLHNHPSFGFAIGGYFADAPAHDSLPLASAPYLGPLEAAPAYIEANAVSTVFIAVRGEDHPKLFDVVSECEGINVEFLMVPDILEVLTAQVRLRELDDVPFLTVKTNQMTTWGRIAKRAFDFLVSLFLVILLSPLALLIALLVKVSSRGPVLFSQKRVGLDGKEFTMFKFRSMRAGAEHLDSQAGLGIRDDPRRTAVGTLLRKTSLDELPQLLNVVRGEMSLVGPRPERTQYVHEFQRIVPRYLDRHRVKTGLTGWAQVNGLRGDTSLEERIRYDLYYIENWSFLLDIKILLRTVRALFKTAESGKK
jgi:exopolysaccharide biosynthesis polyprenyl glycosylphosphotransferase